MPLRGGDDAAAAIIAAIVAALASRAPLLSAAKGRSSRLAVPASSRRRELAPRNVAKASGTRNADSRGRYDSKANRREPCSDGACKGAAAAEDGAIPRKVHDCSGVAGEFG